MKRNTGEYRSNFIMQAGILAIAGIVVRIIGLLYRAPLTAVIGDEGNGYYSFAYNIYTNILLISSYSIPSAISKIMSQRLALKEYRNAQRIFRCALVYVTIVGGIAATFAYVAAGMLVVDNAIPVLRIFAPTILLSGFLGVFRGFFQAHRSMVPTSISQILEQIINAGVSIGAALLFIRMAGGIDIDETTKAVRGASGSAIGTGSGVLIALLFVGGVYLYNRRKIMARYEADKTSEIESYGNIARDILLIVTPFILSTFIYNCSTAINQTIYARTMLTRLSQSQVSMQYGIYSGKAVVLRNVPVALASAMSSAIIPTVAGAWALKDYKDARRKVGRALKVTMLVAIPCMFGFLFLARPIVSLLFPQRSSLVMASRLLMALSVTVVFYCISTITNGVLQSIGQVHKPVTHAAIALVAQSAVLWVLLVRTGLGIYTIVIADIVFALLVCILNGYSLRKTMKYQQETVDTYLLPAICSLFMGGLARLVYNLVFRFSRSNIISLLAAVGVAVIFYMITVVQSGAISEEEMTGSARGAVIYEWLGRLHLVTGDERFKIIKRIDRMRSARRSGRRNARNRDTDPD